VWGKRACGMSSLDSDRWWIVLNNSNDLSVSRKQGEFLD